MRGNYKYYIDIVLYLNIMKTKNIQTDNISIQDEKLIKDKLMDIRNSFQNKDNNR